MKEREREIEIERAKTREILSKRKESGTKVVIQQKRLAKGHKRSDTEALGINVHTLAQQQRKKTRKKSER